MSETDESDYEYNDDDENGSVEETSVEMADPSDGGADKKEEIRMVKAEDFTQEIDAMVRETSDVLQLPAAAATALLCSYAWSKDALVGDFFQSDPDTFLKKCGVYFRCHAVKKPNNTDGEPCRICYDDDTKMLAMPCGHEFCHDCWKDFSQQAIDDGNALSATCPDQACTEKLTVEELEVVVDAAYLEKYNMTKVRSFVEASALTRWCPGPGCSKIAAATSVHALELVHNIAECPAPCGTEFCVVCGMEPHAPSNCADLMRWIDKSDAESMNATWICANTKRCPSCDKHIEKNGGCAHMNCGQCTYQFCWICMKEWNGIGGYNHKCNVYNPDGSEGEKGRQDAVATAKKELERYVHYHDRYRAHADGQKFALETVRDLINMEPTSEIPWDAVELMRGANELLVTCRRALKYTYVHGYSVFKFGSESIEKERFEHHQSMLEGFTERLSGQTEKEMVDLDQPEISNLSAALKMFVRNMLEFTGDDDENDTGKTAAS